METGQTKKKMMTIQTKKKMTTGQTKVKKKQVSVVAYSAYTDFNF